MKRELSFSFYFDYKNTIDNKVIIRVSLTPGQHLKKLWLSNWKIGWQKDLCFNNDNRLALSQEVLMKITITKAAQNYLNKKIDQKVNLLLTTDDGSNRYSKVGGSCSIGDKFQLVITKKADPNYQIELKNELGYHFLTSENDQQFFTSGLALDISHNLLLLKDDSGLLDSSLTINHADQSDKLTEEEKNK